jgi:prefoldin subunit 5
MAALVEDLKASSNLIRAADKDLDDLKSAKDEMQNKLAETTKDLAYSRLAVDTMSERDKRFTETIAKCGAVTGEDIGDFIERTCAERDKLHGELVNVRSALADVSAERDSLRTTLASWEAADTTPFLKVPDVADHVMPPVLPVPAAELPMCTTCHGCGGLLDQAYQGSDLDWLECGNMNCDRGMTAGPVEIGHPYYEPCKSSHPVRHE